MTALAAAGVLFISACGSADNGSSPSTAAAAPSTSPSTPAGSATGAPTSEAPAGSTTASSVDQTSAPSSDPTSAGDSSSVDSPDSATSPTSTESSAPDSSSPTSEGEVPVVDAAGLTVLARQLGCPTPKVQAAKPGSEGAKAGATAVASCTLDGTQYLLASTKNPAGVPALIKSFSASIAGGQKVFYVVGPTWFALGSKTGEDAPADVAEAIQAKIGGEVSSTD